ncbi:MAG: class IV adenylate cyclase [Candidatus Nanogingivalaceae bacterium]|nr:class IV adenylate cyclase [Candidatus Nanogingivalaceae bacterium]
MREIEIKARLQNREGMLAMLAAEGVVLGEPVHQRDQVFGLPGEAGGDGNTAPWLRVRTETRGQGENETKRALFTFKRAVTGQLDSIEHETEVRDPDAMIAIVKELGFVAFSDMSKIRQTGNLGEVGVCVDSVEGLGDFMELERLTDDDADPVIATDDLWRIMARLDISRDDEVTDGYDILMKKLRAQ